MTPDDRIPTDQKQSAEKPAIRSEQRKRRILQNVFFSLVSAFTALAVLSFVEHEVVQKPPGSRLLVAVLKNPIRATEWLIGFQLGKTAIGSGIRVVGGSIDVYLYGGPRFISKTTHTNTMSVGFASTSTFQLENVSGQTPQPYYSYGDDWTIDEFVNDLKEDRGVTIEESEATHIVTFKVKGDDDWFEITNNSTAAHYHNGQTKKHCQSDDGPHTPCEQVREIDVTTSGSGTVRWPCIKQKGVCHVTIPSQ